MPRNGGNADPVGAALVVGGGIAGMQASLDLADGGFRVTLVESASAIGGHMARLDKTFPTNDCAMCTISPRLVDTAGHPSIDILTDSEVVGLAGEAGRFTATVRTRARYVDTAKCTACGKCASVCPVTVANPFDGGMSHRNAAYKLYPQATPDAYAIDKRGVAPCRAACPTGQRAQGYIALIAAGRIEDAYRTIKEDNPFPGICGRICNARCEDACSRGRIDEAVNIRGLKRYVADAMLAGPRVPPEPTPRRYAERVAVIGAGPCGLTAAQDLCREGYAVTVFEALPVAGGMLRVGVPEFRLPAAVVEREVQDILDLGIELRLSSPVASIDRLFAEGFAAVLIAVGAHEGVRLPIPGNELDGVLVNTAFLRDVRLADKTPPIAGRRVVVIGGGDVAMDVARTALRLGARDVTMAMREPLAEMPAAVAEAEAARAEGIRMLGDLEPVRVIGDSGRVSGVEFQRIASLEKADDGRIIPHLAPGSECLIAAEAVIFSVGQKAGLALPVDAERSGVFAAGDAVSGTAFVVEAVAGGHRAARAIHGYLRGEPTTDAPPQPVAELGSRALEEAIAATRVAMPRLEAAARTATFAEVDGGYNEDEARAEAARCLSCGICSECLACVDACDAGAIDLDMRERTIELPVGAVVLAPGYRPYRAELAKELGLGRYANVVTSLQYERLLSASGPTGGRVRRPSDGEAPRRVAFLQCVGSRDATHDYCSAVCCMYATKQALMTMEHGADAEAQVFMMDVRAFGKGYQAYYRSARERGVRYTRCRISSVKEDPASRDLVLRYMDCGSPQIREEAFDMVVLAVGMEIAESTRALARRLGVALDAHGFCETEPSLRTSRPGVYAVGPFREPKDIPESLLEASAAAAEIGALLALARGTCTRAPEYPPERDVGGEEPRIAVFACHCGTNIGGFLDVPGVAAYAGTLPGVVHAEDTLYACSHDSVAHIGETVRARCANRVVIASCTPLTHEPLFRSGIRAAGLNPYLLDMANIRNHCSWVHGHDRAAATAKAKDLVRMSVARVANQQPLATEETPVVKAALVIGGGAAGMSAALSLADQGFPVHLVERDGRLGGALRHVHYGLDGLRGPQTVLAKLVNRVDTHPRIAVHLATEVVACRGFVGNFTSTLADGTEIRHGATVVCVGGVEHRGDEYGYGTDSRIVTVQELESLLAREETAVLPRSLAMILCVGPGERACGRICCTTALKNALVLKRLVPDARVTVIYKDIRTYGFKERIYRRAREAGVVFVRYDESRPPEVAVESGRLSVRVWEDVLGNEMTLAPDMVALAAPVVPAPSAPELARKLRVPVDANGFFLEAHVKLRPVDFLSDGIFMAGLAHHPKLLDEAIVQARAAAARAARVLSRDTISTGGAVAVVDPDRCVACLTCLRLCAYGAPQIVSDAARIEAALCRGCGLCAAACPGRAIELRHATAAQLRAKVDALLAVDTT